MKITLKTLPQATAQQVFDQATNYFRNATNACRTADGDCAYRQGGQTCVAGDFISDDEYAEHDEEFESNPAWLTLFREGVVPGAHVNLISDLQHVHDGWRRSKESGKLSTWLKIRLSSVAEKYGLMVPFGRDYAEASAYEVARAEWSTLTPRTRLAQTGLRLLSPREAKYDDKVYCWRDGAEVDPFKVKEVYDRKTRCNLLGEAMYLFHDEIRPDDGVANVVYTLFGLHFVNDDSWHFLHHRTHSWPRTRGAAELAAALRIRTHLETGQEHEGKLIEDARVWLSKHASQAHVFLVSETRAYFINEIRKL